MTVNTIQDSITYSANGSTTLWDFTFPGVDDQFIEVFVIDSNGNQAQLSPNSFTVTLDPPIDPNPTSAGGTVLFPISGPPLAVGNKLVIQRVLPIVQETSLANQGILYPKVIEQALDYLTLLGQFAVGTLDRAFKVPFGDPLPADVPPVAQRKNQGAFFDAQGNLTPGNAPGGSVFISAAMQPVVGAATLELARQLMGVTVPTQIVNSTYVVTQGNNRQIVNLTGAAFYSVSVGAASGFAPTFWVILFNNDTRGKSIQISGKPTFILWPGQFVWIIQDGSGTNWMVTNPGRWYSATPQNFYVDGTLGADTDDGLALGTGAFKTIQHAIDVVADNCDGDFPINVANGTYDVGSGIVVSKRLAGSTGYQLIGNVANSNLVVLTINTNNRPVFDVRDGSVAAIRGFRFNAVSQNNVAVRAINSGTLYIQDVTFGPFNGSSVHLTSYQGGTIVVTGNYHIANGGGVLYHTLAEYHSRIVYQNINNPGVAQTITVDGPAGVGYFYTADLQSLLVHWQTVNVVNPGFIGGYQVSCLYNSVVNTIGPVPGDPSGNAISNGGWWIAN